MLYTNVRIQQNCDPLHVPKPRFDIPSEFFPCKFYTATKPVIEIALHLTTFSASSYCRHEYREKLSLYSP